MSEWLQELSVGEWWTNGEDPFEIVGVDASAEVVLVQHYDGSLEEFEFDSWLEMSARPCAPPEDYAGALDLEREDYGMDLDDAVCRRPLRGDPLDELDVFAH